MKKKLHIDSMVVRILAAVIAGIICAVVAVSTIVIKLSEDVFMDTYGKSQEQVFMQIEKELNTYHENLTKIIDAVDASWAFRLYLRDEQMDTRLAFQTAYKMNQDLKEAIPSNINDISVLVIGLSGKSYLNRKESVILPVEEILASEITQNALNQPETVQYQYADTGFTSTTRNSPVMMAVKVLRYRESQVPYAVVYITMKESDVSKFYHYFTSEYSQFYMIDSMGKIVSSDSKERVGKEAVERYFFEETGEDQELFIADDEEKHLTVLKRHLSYYNYTIYGIIDSGKALGKLYNVPQLWIICSLIAVAVVMAAFFAVRQTTKPLSELVRRMARAGEGGYGEHIQVMGSEEVQELTSTYNSMLDDINRYIDELMAIQREKRKAEISALQMQINPHYIYNTLASIKWLIYQGDVEKSTKTIDAFIALLRNTIGNMDEYITVSKEIENLKSYVLINNNRYGDKVNVEYYVNFGCELFLLPKMILQPFVENAFFHAFPYDRQGKIVILIRTLGKNLQIQVTDDGVGMNQKRLMELSQGKTKSEHFTGIGVNNVDDRLKLLYGGQYGIDIKSEEGRGTTITIVLPIQEEKREGSLH